MKPQALHGLPPTSPGCLCTKCGKRPQSAVQRRHADSLPAEQWSWCGLCRGLAKQYAELRAFRAAHPDRTPGQTHCATGCGRRLGLNNPKAVCSECTSAGRTVPANDNARVATRAA